MEKIDIYKDTFQVGKYKISSLCLHSYPCKHYVEFSKYGIDLLHCFTSKRKLYSGDHIFTMLANDNLSHPHFDVYKEFIRKRDNPTNEEMAVKRMLHEQHLKKMEQQKLEAANRKMIIDKYKSSTYIERKKLKHTTA